jgi:hypothetical protein
MKNCTTCKTDKPLTDFYRSARSRDGHETQCKVCRKAGVIVGKNIMHEVEQPLQSHSRTLWRYYGITRQQYEQMLEAQGGVCAICEQPETAIDKRNGRVRNLAVDHDHETGAIRGLLCGNCNKALGCFKDDPEIMRKAIGYVIGSQQR